jgi:hypothetical protein
VQKSQPLIYDGFTGAFASFMQTGDPNAHKLTPANVPGVPERSTGEEFVIEPTGFANIRIDQLRKRCAFWQEHGPEIPI